MKFNGMNTKESFDEMVLKFPSVMRARLKEEANFFPDNTQFYYKPLQAYRCIEREPDDNSSICKDDFKSYAELKRRK